jgi:hypothetical protein
MVSSPRVGRCQEPLGVLADLALAPVRVADMEQLVDDVRVGQATGVEDRGFARLVVGDDADEAVANPAELVTDRELGNALGGYGVLDQPDTSPPVRDPMLDPVSANATHSQ